MNRLACFISLLLLSFVPLTAQTAIPATPADPHQPRPAQPVAPLPVPAAPASTNTAPAPATQIALSIIADTSLKLVLQELAQGWADSLNTSPQVPITLTNAGTLRSKVEAGSTWDLVISADVQDVKEMTASGLLSGADQQSLARNTVVIFGRKALLKDDDLEWFDLTGTEWKKVALGNPDLVASGRVARHALQIHKLMDDDHKDTYLYEPTEGLALSAIQRDQVDAAFVYHTDVATLSLPGFEVFPIDPADAPPIFYVAAVCRTAKNPEQARAFITYCSTEAARAVWAKYGFETN